MFILGILIIVGLFIFRSLYRLTTQDGRIDNKLRMRHYITISAGVLGGLLTIFSLLRIVPAGSAGVQVLFGKVLTKAVLSEGFEYC